MSTVREFVEEFWTLHQHPESGEVIKYVEQRALLELLDEVEIEGKT